MKIQYFAIVFSLMMGLLISVPTINVQRNMNGSDNTGIPLSKIGETWDLTDSPIFIDDSDPNYNWSKTAAENGWCTGSGTWNDPYIIENVLMDGSTASELITIQYSSVYFRIKNSTIKNSQWNSKGIYLYNVANGTVISNIFDNNFRPLCLLTCYNITIQDCTFYNDEESINIWHSFNTTIFNNTVINAQYEGISLSQNQNTTIQANTLVNCSLDFTNMYDYELVTLVIDQTNTVNGKSVYYYANASGLSKADFSNAGQLILANCTNSIISGLDISHGSTSCILLYCRNNTIVENTFYGNTKDGIYLDNCYNNTIAQNSLYDNERTGIWIQRSNNHTVSDNNCTSNYHRGIFLWYSDNNTVSQNNVTSGDVTYGSGIVIDSCENNYLIGNNISKYGYGYKLLSSKGHVITDNAINQTKYGIFLDNTNYSKIDSNFLLNTDIQNIFEENCEGNSFQKNVFNTAIKINTPVFGTHFSQSAPYFDLEIDLIYAIDTRWYSLDNGNTNHTCSNTGQIDQTLWDSQLNGLVIIHFYANDSEANLGITELHLTKDNIKPEIIIISPQPESVSGANAPNFIVQITDEHLNTVWYEIYGISEKFFFTSNGTLDQSAWSSLPEGEITIIFYAEDFAKNLGFKTLTIIKDLTETTDSTTPSGPSPNFTNGIEYLVVVLTMVYLMIARKKK